MAGWDDVDVDFGEEETANFGPRMESGTALYQVETTATISHRGQVTKNPEIRGIAAEEAVFIGAGCHMSLFADMCRSFLVTHGFEAEIDAVAVTDDGSFLVVGDNSGRINFIDNASRIRLFSKMLISQKPQGDTRAFESISFSPINDEGICSLIITTSSEVHLLSNLRLADLREALRAKDLQRGKEIQADMKHEVITTCTEHTIHTTYAVSGSPCCDLITLGEGDSALCLWEKVDQEYIPFRSMPSLSGSGAALKKCIPAKCGKLLIVLDDQGVLSLVQCQLLVAIREWTGIFIKDFSILEPGDSNNNVGDMKMILLTQLPGGGSGLEVASLPDMESVYSLVLSECTFLVHTNTMQEAIYVVEGVPDEMHPGLFRLLHKKQFTEAESFARLFGQDTELVYKAKGNHLFDVLSPWNVAKLTKDEVNDCIKELKACLSLIKDDSFVAQCCTTAALPTFQATLDLLNFAKQRLTKKAAVSSNKTKDSVVISDLLTKTLEMLYRLGTYQVVYGVQEFSGELWDRFLRAKMLCEVTAQLQEGNIRTAVIIWNRHQGEFASGFSVNVLQDLLSSIPEETPSRELQPWLTSDLIPYVIRKAPDGLAVVAAWIEQRARNMEIYEKDNWPSNSLAFCELLQNTCVSESHVTNEIGLATPEELSTQICNLPVGYYQVKNKPTVSEDETPDAFLSLNSLIFQLQELLSLHNKYRCKLTLAEYVRETTDSLTYRMLDRVSAVELIPSAIEKFVRPYMREHRLDEDKILFQYIGDLAKRSCSSKTSRVGQTHWESKAITVIGCIQDPDYKIHAIHDALKRAYIPLGADMEALVQLGLAMDHHRVEELKELYFITELQKMLIQYDLRGYNVQDHDKAQMLMYYILKQDRSTAMADALQVVKMYNELRDTEAYVFRVKFLIENDRLPEAIRLLKSLPACTMMECGQNILHGVRHQLNLDIFFDRETEQLEKMVQTHAACEILKTLLQLPDLDVITQEVLQKDLTDLTLIHALQIEFGEFVTYSTYCDEGSRQRLLQKYLVRCFSKDDSQKTLPTPKQTCCDRKTNKKGATLNILKIQRLGDLLKVPTKTLIGQISLAAADHGQTELAVQNAKKLYADLPCRSVASSLYLIAHALCKHLSSQTDAHTVTAETNLHDSIQEMADSALTHCGSELLCDCLELCKGLSRAKDVLRKCESGDYGSTVQDVSDDNTDFSSKDPYKEWTFDHFFQEEGLVMDSSVANPLVYQHCVASVPVRGSSRLPYVQGRVPGLSNTECSKLAGKTGLHPVQGLSLSAVDTVQYLSQNGHTEMCLGYAMETLGGTIQFLATHSMGGDEFPAQNDVKAIAERGQVMMRDMTLTLLKKSLNKSRIDHHLVIGYLLDLQKKVSFEMLKKLNKNAGHQYKRTLAIARIGMDLAELTNEPKVKFAWQECIKNSEWGLKFSKLKVPFSETKAKVERRNLIPGLVSCKNITISIIKEFCSAFDLLPEDAVLIYLEKLLLPSSGHSDTELFSSTPSNHQEETVSAEILDRAQQAIDELKGSDAVIKLLLEITQKVDVYDYERLKFVYAALEKLAPSPESSKALQLLEKLQVYKRVAPPGEYEIEYRPITEEQQVMYGSRRLHELSSERLPFQPILYGQPWKIITPELNEKTVDLLYPIASILELSADNLYATTLRNIVSAHVKKPKTSQKGIGPDSQDTKNIDKSKCSWTLDKESKEHFFPTINKLLMKLTTCESAALCSNWLMKTLPIGAEKVVALKACVDFTERWAAACGEGQMTDREKATAMNKQFLTWYKRLSIEQALFQNSIGSEDLLALSNSPTKLIFKLYEHSSILLRSSPGVVIDSLPDIHGVTDEIAEISEVDIGQLRLSLIEKWLPSSHQEDAEMTFNLSTINLDTTCLGEEEETTQDEINLKRVIYLLQNMDQGHMILLNYIYEKGGPSVNNRCRVRAMRCLFSLMDMKTVQKFLGKVGQPIPFQEHLKKYLYMVKLDQLHLPQSLEQFSGCNKEGLVRGIWLNHSHDRQAVRLVSDLCLDFHIHDVQLWNSVLQQLMAFQMLDYLRHILVRISYDPELWKVASYHRTWSRVISMPLSAAVTPLSKDQLTECLGAFSLIHRCPLILDLDLPALAKRFQKLDLPTCALGCLLLIPQDDTRAELLEGLLQGQVKVIVKQLSDWMKQGMILPMMKQIQQCLYNHINDCQQYELLQGTGWYETFSLQLVSRDNIQSFLSFIVRNQRMNEAAKLLLVYEQVHMESEFSRAVRDKENDMEKLRVFITLNRLKDLEEYLPEKEEQESDGEINCLDR